MIEAIRIVRSGGMPMLGAAAAVSLGILVQATTVAGAANVANSNVVTANAGYGNVEATQVFEKKKKKKKTLRGTQTRGSFTDG